MNFFNTPHSIVRWLQAYTPAWLLPLAALLLLAGCTINPNALTSAQAGPKQLDAFNGLVEEIGNYAVVQPASTPTPVKDPGKDKASAEINLVVSTSGSRANVRSAPNTTAEIVAKANPGDLFKVVAKSEDGTWWQICCVQGSDGKEANAWIAASVVSLAGEGDVAVATTGKRALEAKLKAQWQVDWNCGSDRCDVKSCAAVVDAQVNRPANQQYLTVEHQVTWDKSCFATDSWVFDVDQFTGKERTGEYKDNFLYSYWVGTQSEAANGVVKLADGRAVAVLCTGPHTVEIEEGSGWTTAYEGNTCHDTRTGMLVLLTYNKRWLYTGEFEGQTYDQAYFGDFETLQQVLTSASAELAFVKKK
jgi:ferredoxin